MSCVDVMYQPYASGFSYHRHTSEPPQAFGVPRMHEPLDLGSYSASTCTSTTGPVKEEEEDKGSQPKETHYLNANCVLLTYFSGDTSSVVDEHFSRALSQTSSFSPDSQNNKHVVKVRHIKSYLCTLQSQMKFWQVLIAPSNTVTVKCSVGSFGGFLYRILFGYIERKYFYFCKWFFFFFFFFFPDSPLMSQRNFPPSFWNSNYQPTTGLMASHHDFQFSSAPYFPSSLHGISSLHQDPWHYPLSSQTHGVSYPHRSMHYDLSYPSMASTSRFSPGNYGTLLMQPSMRSSQFGSMAGQCDLTKPSDASRPRYPDHRIGSDFPSHTALPGLDSSIQEAGKDLYWF
ncbi:transcription cofactor vestigial-like protein 2 [Gigantopelta aegis]|uniref:transcription cofactor vestigial-like protein 2 n=1 Tax=Gigantopelta aegis TaxID=1735272 RepID=UPI001B8879AE|nr:transcription cofactor vestigial-like protein 2 [Gigantopelta aegis]